MQTATNSQWRKFTAKLIQCAAKAKHMDYDRDKIVSDLTELHSIVINCEYGSG